MQQIGFYMEIWVDLNLIKIECRMVGCWCRLLSGNRNKLSFLVFSFLKNLYDKGLFKVAVDIEVKANI